MKIKHLLPAGMLLLTCMAAQAQDKKTITLDEAITLATTKSNQAAIANTRVTTSGLEVANTKNNAYPDFKVSGQYMRLTQPNVNLRLPVNNNEPAEDGETETTNTSPEVSRVIIGQATLSLPIFSGFRLKNSVAASENLYKAESFNAAHTKEQLAMQVIVLYTNLYKAQQSVGLIQENLKSANQRVTDFTAMEQNGLLARNDLLKAQLQASNVQLTLEDANKNVATINYQLATLLKLPEGTQLTPQESYFENTKNTAAALTENAGTVQRNDLEALRYQQKAAEANIKVVNSNYYPTIALTGGYILLDVQNVFEVHNAINFGVGISYNFSDIFKNKKHVQAARSRAEETRQSVEMLSDNIKVQVHEAAENYNLAVKQNRVYTEAVSQAAENYRIVKDKYDNGLADTNDLLEADVQQLQSQLNETFSRADITQRYYEFLNTSGKLTQSFNIPTNN